MTIITPEAFVREFQRRAGLAVDSIPGRDTQAKLDEVMPGQAFDRQEFLARYVNNKAPAITDADIANAANRLNVSPAHIRMLRKVESNEQSFGPSGRPIILFEPHIFHRQTGGKYSPTSFSYAKWGQQPYPKTQDARWDQMADAAEKDESAALESASWGLFQIMGFNWKDLGFSSVQHFASRMAATEADHLDALVAFIEKNGLANALRRCRAGDPDSCRDFARGYNGSGYEANRYHIKMSEALR